MEMKMATISVISVLLFGCSVFASKDSAGSCDYYAATNDNVTVPLRHKLKDSEQLRWMHENLKIFDKRPNRLVTGNKDDIDPDGSLRLKNVKKANAGSYTPEVFTEDGKQMGTLSSISLCVMDPVPKPEVKIECQSSSVNFTCIVGQAQVNFAWLKNNMLLKNKKGQTLLITAKDVEKDSFICNVSNHVSYMTSKPATQNCIKPASIFPETFFGINTWVLVGVGGGVVLVLIIVIIACCIRNRRKKSMQVKDEEELRLGWTNQNQQHQHNCPPDQHPHPHHHQQHPAGHTGPRQHRSKQQRNQQRPRAPDQPNGQPQPSPRRPAQGHRPVDKVDDDQPPPLPQPRKKAPRTPHRV